MKGSARERRLLAFEGIDGSNLRNEEEIFTV